MGSEVIMCKYKVLENVFTKKLRTLVLNNTALYIRGLKQELRPVLLDLCL